MQVFIGDHELQLSTEVHQELERAIRARDAAHAVTLVVKLRELHFETPQPKRRPLCPDSL
jgi:hypothetical protein